MRIMRRLQLVLLLAGLAWGGAHPPRNAIDNDVAGVVRPIRWVRVSVETEGRIVARNAEEHDAVGRGAVVLELDETLKAADLKIAEAALLEARARRELAEKELARARELITSDISSQADVDRAVAEEKAAQAAVLTAEARAAAARYVLERTRVTAPFDGVVTRFHVEEGEYVTPGTVVFWIMDVERVKIESWVDEDLARQLRPRQNVAVAVAGRTASATIRSVAPGTDNTSRTFKVVLTAENPPEEDGAGFLFRPGATVSWPPPRDGR